MFRTRRRSETKYKSISDVKRIYETGDIMSCRRNNWVGRSKQTSKNQANTLTTSGLGGRSATHNYLQV